LFGAASVKRLNSIRFVAAHKKARLQALRDKTQKYLPSDVAPRHPRTEIPLS